MTCGRSCARRCSRRPSPAARWRAPAGSSPGYEPERPRLLQRRRRADRPGRRRRRSAWTRRSSSAPRTSTPRGRVAHRRRRHPRAALRPASRRPPRPGPRRPALRRGAGAGAPGALGRHPGVPAALAAPQRHHRGLLALRHRAAGRPGSPALAGREVLVIDAEDTFTAMIAQQLRALGLRGDRPRLRRGLPTSTGYDLVVLGPGPGDPARPDRPEDRLPARGGSHACCAERRPFLAVCLSHQVLSLQCWASTCAAATQPNQGVQTQDRPVRRSRTGRLLQHLRRAEPARRVQRGRVRARSRSSRDQADGRGARPARRPASPPCSSTPSPC